MYISEAKGKAFSKHPFFNEFTIADCVELPWQLRQQRARNIQESERASPASTPTKDSPPNTPDRPAPLTFKSRHSNKSSKAPSTGSRSVSAPITRNKRPEPTLFPRNSHILEETTSHPLLASPTPLSIEFSGRVEADDVFGIPESEAPRNAEPVSPIHVFDESRLRALNQLQGTADVSHQYQQRIYELSRSEISSTTSDEAADGLRLLNIDEAVAETTLTQLSRIQKSDILDTTHGHQAGFICDSVISDNNSNRHTTTYASSNAASDPFEYDKGTFRRGFGLPRFKFKGHKPNYSADPLLRPLPQRGYKSTETGRLTSSSPYLRPLPLRKYQSDRSQPPSPSLRPLTLRDNESEEQILPFGSPRSILERNNQSNETLSASTPIRRPLPLRTYGSKASLSFSPTPSSSSRIPRLKMTGTMMRNHRPTRLAMPALQTPTRPSRNVSAHAAHQDSPLSRTQLYTASPYRSQDPVRTPTAKTSTQALDEAADRQSISLMLDHFPTPPTQSPAITSAESTTPISALANACRSSTTTPSMIQEMLETTRAHGEALPITTLTSMSAPERSWRENNEMLLIVVYGRQDTELSDGDVANVDTIVQHMGLERGRWLMDVFRKEAPIF